MHAVQNKCLFYIIQILCWYRLLFSINTTETHVICIHCISIFVYHMSLFKKFFGSNYHWFWKTLLFKDYNIIMFCSKRYALVLIVLSDCVISGTRTIFYYCNFVVLNQQFFFEASYCRKYYHLWGIFQYNLSLNETMTSKQDFLTKHFTLLLYNFYYFTTSTLLLVSEQKLTQHYSLWINVTFSRFSFSFLHLADELISTVFQNCNRN